MYCARIIIIRRKSLLKLELDLENNFIFQQDNDPKYKIKKTIAFSNLIKTAQMTATTDLMNPIENLWAYLELL